MKINHKKFNNDGYFKLNDEIFIYQFIPYMQKMYFTYDVEINNDNWYSIGLFRNINVLLDEIKNDKNKMDEKIKNGGEYVNPNNAQINHNIFGNNIFNDLKNNCDNYINQFNLFCNLKKYNCNNENTLCLLMNVSGDDIFTFINFENEIILKCGCMDKFVVSNVFDEYVTILSIINDCLIYD